MSNFLDRMLGLQQRLQAQSQQPPLTAVIDVVLGDQQIGRTTAGVVEVVTRQVKRTRLDNNQLRIDDAGLMFAERSAVMDKVAQALRNAGNAPGWRDEQLDVRTGHASPALASIERAACRPLGIATRAVHMNGVLSDGRLLVARRASHKRVDPGALDNLVGGMVSAGETDLLALTREAYEEAALDLSTVNPIEGKVIDEARPVVEGYLIERIQVFDVDLPASFEPRNVDGEVATFAALEVEALINEMERGAFTLEAALVTLDHLLHRRNLA